MKKSILNQCLSISRKKIHTHPEFRHFIHYSFIVQENSIIEWATNCKKVPPIHYGYMKKAFDDTFVPKSHSEIEAYRKGRGILNKDLFEIVNIRLNKIGELRLSKPCKCCFDLLKELGCYKFYFSWEGGFLTC